MGSETDYLVKILRNHYYLKLSFLKVGKASFFKSSLLIKFLRELASSIYQYSSSIQLFKSRVSILKKWWELQADTKKQQPNKVSCSWNDSLKSPQLLLTLLVYWVIGRISRVSRWPNSDSVCLSKCYLGRCRSDLGGGCGGAGDPSC